jgi:hypothetical protein
MNRLITFGCSTTQGEGLEFPNLETWGYHLSTYMGMEHLNLGIAGASNKLISYTIKNFAYQYNDIVFILWCNVNRYTILESEYEYNKIYPLSESIESVLYYKHFHYDVDQIFMNKAFTSYAIQNLEIKGVKYYQLFFNKELEEFVDCKKNIIPIYLTHFSKKYPLAIDKLHMGKEGNKEYAKKIYNYMSNLL